MNTMDIFFAVLGAGIILLLLTVLLLVAFNPRFRVPRFRRRRSLRRRVRVVENSLESLCDMLGSEYGGIINQLHELEEGRVDHFQLINSLQDQIAQIKQQFRDLEVANSLES